MNLCYPQGTISPTNSVALCVLELPFQYSLSATGFQHFLTLFSKRVGILQRPTAAIYVRVYLHGTLIDIHMPPCLAVKPLARQVPSTLCRLAESNSSFLNVQSIDEVGSCDI